MNEERADTEALTTLKALYFGLYKQVYTAKDALNTRCLAIDHKGSGNLALKAGRFEEAIEWYTKAIELEPNYVYFANRSAAFLALDSCEEALRDANMSIRTKPSYLKAYHRKASALKSLGRWEEAAGVARIGLEHQEPWSGDTSGLVSLQ